MNRVRMLLWLALAAFALTTTASSQEEEKVLTWSMSFSMNCLDPAIQQGWPDSLILANVYEPLVTVVPGTISDFQPALAESWTVSDDGLVYTFMLREGAMWHDGYGPVTADDVKASWERMRDPETNARGAADFEPIDTIEVLDPMTVRVTMEEPFAPFLTYLAHAVGFRIANVQAIEDRGEDHCIDPVGSGPYEVESAQRQGSVVLVANRNYDLGVPPIDRVIKRHIPEESVAALALRSGEVDLGLIRDAEVLLGLLDEPDLEVNVDDQFSASLLGLWLNTSRPPLDDVRVRQALTHAIDRELLVPVVTEGLVDRVAHGILPISVFGFNDDVPKYEYDPERARALLEDAGLGDGFEVEAIAIQAGFNVAMLTIVQQMWADVGVDLVIETSDRSTIRARQRAGDFDINVSNPSRADPDQFLRYFKRDNVPPGPNWMYYDGGDELEELMLEQARTPNPGDRYEILAEIQEIIARDAPMIPLWYPLEGSVYHESVTGVVPNVPSVNMLFYLMDIER